MTAHASMGDGLTSCATMRTSAVALYCSRQRGKGMHLHRRRMTVGAIILLGARSTACSSTYAGDCRAVRSHFTYCFEAGCS